MTGTPTKPIFWQLSGRASGIFVTSFYAAASVAGYAIGWLAAEFGWTVAGDLQLCAACLVGTLLALALKPGLQFPPPFVQVSQLLLQLFESRPACLVLLFLQGLSLYF